MTYERVSKKKLEEIARVIVENFHPEKIILLALLLMVSLTDIVILTSLL